MLLFYKHHKPLQNTSRIERLNTGKDSRTWLSDYAGSRASCDIRPVELSVEGVFILNLQEQQSVLKPGDTNNQELCEL